jgi:hypothetical protein
VGFGSDVCRAHLVSNTRYQGFISGSLQITSKYMTAATARRTFVHIGEADTMFRLAPPISGLTFHMPRQQHPDSIRTLPAVSRFPDFSNTRYETIPSHFTWNISNYKPSFWILNSQRPTARTTDPLPIMESRPLGQQALRGFGIFQAIVSIPTMVILGFVAWREMIVPYEENYYYFL